MSPLIKSEIVRERMNKFDLISFGPDLMMKIKRLEFPKMMTEVMKAWRMLTLRFSFHFRTDGSDAEFSAMIAKLCLHLIVVAPS